MLNLNDYLKNIHDLLNNDKLDSALELCNQNTAKKIDHIVYNFKGVIYLKKNDLIKAQENFINSINFKIDFIDPYKNLFVIFNKRKEFSNLLKVSFEILEFDKKNPIYNFQTGYALEKNGLLTKSIELYKLALDLGFKDKKKIFNNLGNIYSDLGNVDESINLYKNAYLENSKDEILLNNLIGAYLEKRNIEKTKYYLDQAKKLNSTYSHYKYNHAKYLFLIHKIDDAIDLLKKIISKESNIAFIGLLCKIYFRTNRLSEGNQLLAEKILEHPNDQKLLRFLGFRSLIDGDFEKGWTLYEYRQSNFNTKFASIPQWKGQDLNTKKILVYNEQGIGDAIQFSKYLINLNEICKNIDFVLNKNLIEIFNVKDFEGINLVKEENIDLKNYDFKISLGSLIKFFYKDLNPTYKNLIKVDLEEAETFKKQIDKKKLNIGVAWSGNYYGPKEPHRSIPLNKFRDIISSNFNFYCLQNEIWESDKDIFKDINIINKGNLNLKSLCSFVQGLDLVISSDTSILHLAASLGKETWVVLSLDPDWRWGKFQEFYKYKNIKIYRQGKYNDWSKVIQIIKNDLEKKL